MKPLSEEEIIAPIPADWIDLDSVIIEVMRSLGEEIPKQSISRVARRAGITVKQMPIVVRSSGRRGDRQRSRLVMCVPREDLSRLLAEIEDRLKYNTTLFETKQQRSDPTPDEIRQRAEEVRRDWSEIDWVNRSGGKAKDVETPQLHVTFQRGQIYSIG